MRTWQLWLSSILFTLLMWVGVILLVTKAIWPAMVHLAGVRIP